MQTASGTRLWLILWKAFDSLRQHAERHIRSLGLGLSDFGVLEILFHKGCQPVNVIGGMLRLTSGSITAFQFSKLPAIPWISSSTGPLPVCA